MAPEVAAQRLLSTKTLRPAATSPYLCIAGSHRGLVAKTGSQILITTVSPSELHSNVTTYADTAASASSP